MSGEALFKSIVSGENQSILGDIARSSLGFLSKGYEKAVSMRNAKFDEAKALQKLQYLLSVLVNITAGGNWQNTDGYDLSVMYSPKRAFILRCLVVVIEQKITRRISLFLKTAQCL